MGCAGWGVCSNAWNPSVLFWGVGWRGECGWNNEDGEPGVRPTSDCVNRLYLLGLTLCPSHSVYRDDEKRTETRCQSGLFTLIGRESANKEAHLPETMILEIPLRRLERVREEAVRREGTRTGISRESWS